MKRPRTLTLLAFVGLLACGVLGIYVGSWRPVYDGSKTDEALRARALRQEARARLSRLAGDVELVTMHMGKRRILEVVSLRRQRGLEIVPSDYFSPYWQGQLPDVAEYDFLDSSALSDDAVDRLTSYSVPGVECLSEAQDRKSTRLNSSHSDLSRMPSSA